MPLRIVFCVDVLASMVITHYNECGALTDVEMCIRAIFSPESL